MIKQKEKGMERIILIMKGVVSIFILVFLMLLPLNFFIGVGLGILICLSMIYDMISYPKKEKEIIKYFQENGKIPIKIVTISKRREKKDSDLLQEYIVNWAFFHKKVPHITTKTRFYSDEPDFMFKYRGKEASIEYDSRYYNKYRINLPVE